MGEACGDGSWIEPRNFAVEEDAGAGAGYLADGLVGELLNFFARKGLARLKEEDAGRTWYADWLAYQAERGMYARLLAPGRFSTLGTRLDLLRLTRFLEVFAFCSPAHGYSLQVSLLGFFSILAGDNEALKREAAGLLESGGLLAFGVSERAHGADLLATEFTLKEVAGGDYVASGSKYYIGNANCAGMIALLARREELQAQGARARRAPLAMFVLRPREGAALQALEKIETLGVRAAFVGNFSVAEEAVAREDIFAEGRRAWDAVFATVTLGKFFLGFGSIGICERAMGEAAGHLRGRILYGKPAIEMGHLRRAMARAYARLAAMKLYAYRALDYVAGAREGDRRYLFFAAVQKAIVSTEGVKVMAEMSQCVGAFGFESRTFFEMALRDAQLIPGLEGSVHVNLSVAAEFVEKYFTGWDGGILPAKSLGGKAAPENNYLFAAKAGGFSKVCFPPYLRAFRPWGGVENVGIFVEQMKAVRLFLRGAKRRKAMLADGETAMALGGILAMIAYGQLVLEQAGIYGVSGEMVAVIFHLLVEDLSAAVLRLAGFAGMDEAGAGILLRGVRGAKTGVGAWDLVAGKVGKFE